MNIRNFASNPLAFFDALAIPSASGDKPFSEVMADHQSQWFADIAPSLVAVATGKKPPIGKFWCERTKGASKDSDVACCLLWLLAFTKRPLDMQVGAADRDQANEVRKAVRDLIRLNSWLSQRVEVQAWSAVCKGTSSECSIIPADVAGSHGARPDVLFLNELSHVTKEEFASNLLDNATKKPHGLVIVATNSGFTGTWQERWRDLARDSDAWHFHAMCEPAPWLSADVLMEAERRNAKARFLRLFWGVWVSSLGDALDEDDIKAAVSADRVPVTLSTFFVAGLDLGIRHDHSALVIIQGDRATQHLALATARNWAPDIRTGKVNLVAVEEEVYRQHQHYKCLQIGYDPYQAELLAQRLTLRKVPMQEMTFTGGNLNLMANTLLDVFRSRRITLYDHPGLIRDLGRLQLEEKSYGYRLSATRDDTGHADLATALAIALPLAVEAAGRKVIHAGVPTDPRSEYEQMADYLSEKERRLNSAVSLGCYSGGAENFHAALSHLHRTDPFFKHVNR